MTETCKVCDPACGPIEGVFAKCAVPLTEEGRPAVLLLGGFLGGLQLADFIYDKTGTFNFSTQLVLDMSTALFFTLGSLSVYKNDKGFAVPVLRLGIVLLILRILDGVMLTEGVEVWCQQQLSTCPGKELTKCSRYPCTWDRPTEMCVASLAQADCVQNGELYNDEHAVLPQLLAQLLYCWLLAAYTANTKSAGLLAADDGTFPPAQPP